MRSTSHIKSLAKSIFKVSLSGVILFGVATGVVLLSPEPEADDSIKLDVKESQANLDWLSPLQETNTHKFATALDELGHEPPRVYDLNDNEFFFSTRAVRNKTPREIMLEYQEKFVEVGLNKTAHTTTPHAVSQSTNDAGLDRLDQMAQAAVRGEILPHQVSETYLSMNGLLVDNTLEENTNKVMASQLSRLSEYSERLADGYEKCNGDPEILKQRRLEQEQDATPSSVEVGLIKNAGQNNCKAGGGTCSTERFEFGRLRKELDAFKYAVSDQPHLLECPQLKVVRHQSLEDFTDDFEDRIKGMRSIEAFYDRERNESIVTAVWTKDNLDVKKLDPVRNGYPKDGLVRGDLPLCSECKRAWSLGGNGDEEPFTSNIVWSDESVERSVGTYRRLLHEEGWTEAGAETVV
ncbi:unnamed protein product, partial [Laminaria digitata]